MRHEDKFLDALKNIFIGAKVEGDSGYINLMRIKARYFEQGVFPRLIEDIDSAMKPFPNFREELFDKLFTFFSRYFSESGSIYFRYTPLHQNIYERVYTDDRDVMLFWKTHMLYYVKTDRLFNNMEIEVNDRRFYFDVSTLEHKKANEKRELIYAYKECRKDGEICLTASYSERSRKTDIISILRAVTDAGFPVDEETIEKACHIFEKQSEVDYFINKNARVFLREQFDLWLYQYVFSGESNWTEIRLQQLQVLKDIAYKIIDFIAQFEDELVKIWNKPKFVLNSNYVITLDKIAERDTNILARILTHPNITNQVEEWHQLGMTPQDFDPEEILLTPIQKIKPHTLDLFSQQTLKERGLITNGYHLPYNPKLVERARDLRKNMTAAERVLWKNYLCDFKYPVLRQRPIDNYIVDFFCAQLKLVIEIDGETHFTEEGKTYDQQRTEILENYGLRILRFKNEEVLKNIEQVKNVIEKINPPLLSDAKNNPPLLPGEKNNPPLPSLQRGKSGDLPHQQEDQDKNPPLAPPFQGGVGGDSLNPQYQHLPLDTRHFKNLELDILSLFDNLDDELDGWLVHSENYQALNTLMPKFRERINCIYIDPPYNATATEIIYENRFKHSSWVSLIKDRIQSSRNWLSNDGILCITIDDYEVYKLKLILDEIYGEENYLATVLIRNNPSGRSTVKGFAINHEYGIFFAKASHFSSVGRFPHTEEQVKRYDELDENGELFEWENFRKNSSGSFRADRPKQFYPFYYDLNSKILRVPKMEWQETSKSWFILENPTPTEITILPIDSSGQERVWRFGLDRVKIEVNELIVKTKGEQNDIYKKKYMKKEGSLPRTWWDNPAYSARDNGTRSVVELFGNEKIFEFPKSLQAVRDSINVCSSEKTSIILDFFAGSGTTAHAVMNLNRADGGKRKYILVEMGEHFNTVILPRIKKVAFSDKWKDGKAQNGKGISHFVKYYELEQYEDVLRRAHYADADLFNNPYQDPYSSYVFLRDLKMLDAVNLDTQNNKIDIHAEKLYSGIDMAETLSCITGKWIKRITKDTVEFVDGTSANLNNPDWDLIKPLVWW